MEQEDMIGQLLFEDKRIQKIKKLCIRCGKKEKVVEIRKKLTLQRPYRKEQKNIIRQFLFEDKRIQEKMCMRSGKKRRNSWKLEKRQTLQRSYIKEEENIIGQ